MGYTVRETFKLTGTLDAAQIEYLLDVEDAARAVVAHEVTEIYVGFPEETFLTLELGRMKRSNLRELIQEALDTMLGQTEYGRGKLDELQATIYELDGALK